MSQVTKNQSSGGGGIQIINTDSGVAIPVAGVVNAFGDGETSTSGAGNTLTVDSTVQTYSPLVVYSAVLNLKVAGINPIFTATSDFYIIFINFYGIDVTSIPGVHVINLGWTPPDYLDYAQVASSVISTGQFYINSPPFSSGGPPVPAGETFVANISTPDTDPIQDIQRIDIVGYYI